MKPKTGVFLFKAWFLGIVAINILLVLGEPILDALSFVMYSVRDTWYLAYPLINIIALVVPLILGVPIVFAERYFLIELNVVQHKKDTPKDAGSGAGSECMCPECTEIVKYGITACEGCSKRK
jgi:hypothetical protein